MESLISNYCQQNISPKADEVLYDIEKETYLEVYQGHMVSGALQGNLLSLLCRMMNAERILEVGTFTGYASIWMARTLTEKGLLTTIEKNDELEHRILNNFKKADVDKRTKLIIGDANQVVPTLLDIFDVVFMDAAKGDYESMFEDVIKITRQGGLIIVDNVLWRGEVALPNRKKIAETLHRFNQKIMMDNRVSQVIIPLRDGLMVCIKN